MNVEFDWYWYIWGFRADHEGWEVYIDSLTPFKHDSINEFDETQFSLKVDE